MWHEATTTKLHLSVYTGVLPILKKYAMVFQVSLRLSPLLMADIFTQMNARFLIKRFIYVIRMRKNVFKSQIMRIGL